MVAYIRPWPWGFKGADLSEYLMPGSRAAKALNDLTAGLYFIPEEAVIVVDSKATLWAIGEWCLQYGFLYEVHDEPLEMQTAIALAEEAKKEWKLDAED